MSDLLREATKRARVDAQTAAIDRYHESMRNVGMSGANPFGLAAFMTDKQRKRRQAKLDETRPLKGIFYDYLTDA